jgi:hypothetical protein
MVPEIMIRDHGLMVPEQMANLANHFFPWRARAFWNQPFSSFGLACRGNRLTNNGSFDPPRAFGLSRVGISAVCSSMMSVSEHPAVVGEAKAHQVCCTLLHSPPLVIAERGHQRGECRTAHQRGGCKTGSPAR